MNAAKIKKANEIFQLAVELPVDERASFLETNCAGEANLRAFVEQLLSHDAAGMSEFMCRPVFTPTPEGTQDLEQTVPKRVGRYAIIRKIGEGGMGVVYEARQDHPARSVALKLLRPGLASGSLLRRFQFEAEVLGHLQHPGIACIYEAGVVEEQTPTGIAVRQPFFAMELIGGQSLDRDVKQNNISVRGRLELLAKICEAVQHAHQKGVIHRDLKPGNILIDEFGSPKILDFGVARATDADTRTTTLQTDVGQLIGTVAYMSPEQVVGDPAQLDTRSDVYSLGVILHELLSGKLPYDVAHCSIPEAARRIRDEEPTRLSSINRNLRGEIETIVARALEKEKSQRYQSASDLGEDLRHYLRGEPIEARRHTGWYVLSKMVKRHRLAAVLIAGLAVTLVASTVALGVLYSSQTRARAAERHARQEAEASATEAKLEAAKAQVVIDFLNDDLLAAVAPEAQGHDVTVREVLDAASRAVEGKFKSEALVEATIRTTLGNTYQSLGEYKQAQPQLETALKLRRAELGEEHVNVAASLNDLASLLRFQGDYAAAERLLREALAMRRKLLGNEHVDVAESLNDLAVVIKVRGNLDEAATLYREALAMHRRLLGDEHPRVAMGMNNMAALLEAQGDYDAAELLLREALAMRRRLLGDEHVHVATGLRSLARLLKIQGDYDGAGPLYREALAMRRRLMGDEHPLVARSLQDLATLLEATRDYDGAESLYREALAMNRKLLGDEHPHVAISLNYLGDFLRAKGDYGAAELLLREALAMHRKLRGDESRAVATNLHDLAKLMKAKGDYDGAELLQREALAIYRKLLGDEHPFVFAGLNNLALLLQTKGDYDGAEPVLREALAIRQKMLGDEHPKVARTIADLGIVLREKGDLDEALTLLSQAVHKFAAALGEESSQTGNARSHLGDCLTKLSRYEEAEQQLLEAHRVLKTALGAEHKYTITAIERFVALYKAWDKPEKAAEWRARQQRTD